MADRAKDGGVDRSSSPVRVSNQLLAEVKVIVAKERLYVNARGFIEEAVREKIRRMRAVDAGLGWAGDTAALGEAKRGG